MRLPVLLIAKRRTLLAMLLGNGLAQGALAVASAWLVMQLFDRLGEIQAHPAELFLMLVACIAGSALLRRQERIHAELLGQHYVRSVRRRLYGRLLNADPRRLQKRRKGALLLKFVGDLSALRRWISLGLARLLVAGVSVVIALAMLSWFYWPFAVGVALVLALAAAAVLQQSGELRGAIAHARRCQANLSANVTEKLSNVATVQVFDQAARERRVMRRQSNRLLKASVAKAAKIGNLRAIVDAAAGLSIVLVLAIAYLVPPQNLSAGLVAAVISIIGFIAPPLRDLGRVQEYWLASQVARQNLRSISRRSTRLRRPRDASPLVIERGAIRIEGVAVAGALEQVDVSAAGGSRVALIGPNGSGKSTLLGVVGRLFDPDEGQVQIDQQDVARVELGSLRRQVAHVSADVPLIRGSLRKNLLYGAGEVAPERLAQVLADCELTATVGQLPDGLDTQLTEVGSNLSQGERVRVALARALLTGPKILLLDEADANLDEQAIRALDKVVQGFTGTLLMATHRVEALDLCDTLWQLRDGRVSVEQRAAGSWLQHRPVSRLRRIPDGRLAVRQE